jgi:hypothetical protein
MLYLREIGDLAPVLQCNGDFAPIFQLCDFNPPFDRQGFVYPSF